MTRALRFIAVAALCVFGLTASASASTTHYWNGDTSTADSAGTANGTWFGTSSYSAGVLGQAFTFDGSSYLDFGLDAGNFGTGDATVSFWAKTSRSDLVMSLLSKRPGCDGGTMWDMRSDAGLGGGATLFTEFDGGGGYNTLRTAPIADGMFHHLMFVRSGGTISMYLDGVLQQTSTMGVTDMTNEAHLLAGWGPCTNADRTVPFQGSIDDIRFSDAAITPYAFTGFYQPVDNGKINVVQAGRGIPVKFSLGGDQGLNIFAPGYPASHTVACGGSGGLDDIEQTVTAGGSSLSYDVTSGQYNYVWKTDKASAGTCRELDVVFNDGSIQRATFQLKK
jgi:hypothetical protein